MMDINLRSVAAEHSYQSYLKYLEEQLTQEVKEEDCIGYVQIRLGAALRNTSDKVV